MLRALLVACTLLCAANTAQAGGILRRGNYQEPATLDPHKFNTVYEKALILDLFEGLTAYSPTTDVQPGVAESWSVSPDGKTWTFILRQGLRWSDGAPLTADDVVFSFRRIIDPKTAGYAASSFYVLKNARAVNSGQAPPDQLGVTSPRPDTIVIELENPAPYLPALLAEGSGAIVPRHVVTKFGDEWIRPEHAVSNGAFILKSWVSHGGVTLARNPMYREPVALDGVIYEPTDDLDAAVTRFRAGGIDMQFEFPSIKTAALREELPAETKVVPGPITFELQLNVRNPKLADVRVRHALSLAIDRELLTNRVLRGGETPIPTYISAAMPGYRPLELPEYAAPMAARLESAKALLAAVGISPASPLRLTYSHGNNSDRKRIAVAISAMWKPLGIIVSLQGLEGKVLFANLRQGDFEMGFMGSSPDYPDAGSFLTTYLSDNPAGNYPRYNSPVYDALVAQAEAAADPAARTELLRQAEARLLEDQPLIPLYAAVTRELVSRQVKGWEPNGTGVHLSRYLSVDRTPPPPQ